MIKTLRSIVIAATGGAIVSGLLTWSVIQGNRDARTGDYNKQSFAELAKLADLDADGKYNRAETYLLMERVSSLAIYIEREGISNMINQRYPGENFSRDIEHGIGKYKHDQKYRN